MHLFKSTYSNKFTSQCSTTTISIVQKEDPDDVWSLGKRFACCLYIALLISLKNGNWPDVDDSAEAAAASSSKICGMVFASSALRFFNMAFLHFVRDVLIHRAIAIV
ncbi:hypothetical protein T4B_13562 [Trichinella pseudospiralis]|uniref:Uncharacterized protein n=1 Tax=Trichinella pseudospiralis TaxID=6337 RepID=A0A0V1GWM7_TRIPS|nr:hypothetical protein T4B_13562 [Trichinella pseudospiralis]